MVADCARLNIPGGTGTRDDLPEIPSPQSSRDRPPLGTSRTGRPAGLPLGHPPAPAARHSRDLFVPRPPVGLGPLRPTPAESQYGAQLSTFTQWKSPSARHIREGRRGDRTERLSATFSARSGMSSGASSTMSSPTEVHARESENAGGTKGKPDGLPRAESAEIGKGWPLPAPTFPAHSVVTPRSVSTRPRAKVCTRSWRW